MDQLHVGHGCESACENGYVRANDANDDVGTLSVSWNETCYANVYDAKEYLVSHNCSGTRRG